MNKCYKPDDKDLEDQYIICSAIWYKDWETQSYLPWNCDKGCVLSGYRHANIIAQFKALTGIRSPLAGESIQGFLTSCNKFVDRVEGLEIAKKKNQLIRNYEITELFSEDIY